MLPPFRYRSYPATPVAQFENFQDTSYWGRIDFYRRSYDVFESRRPACPSRITLPPVIIYQRPPAHAFPPLSDWEWEKKKERIRKKFFKYEDESYSDRREYRSLRHKLDDFRDHEPEPRTTKLKEEEKRRSAVETYACLTPAEKCALAQNRLGAKCAGQKSTCSICLDQLDDVCNRNKVKSLPCAHTFHRQCIDRWMTRTKSCPVCRVRS